MTTMPATLRRRVYCHYCSTRLNLAQKVDGRIRCERCVADNFLDKDNNLVDVPVEVVQGSAGQTDRLEVASDSNVFCQTCLKNQQLYIQALSDYLPDSDDPRYDELERLLPMYRKELELRYPQCCPRCEPRVQASLQQANYAAKTDHLRRMLYQDGKGARKSPLHYKRLIVSLAGLGQVVAIVIQMTWHALASPVGISQTLLTRAPRYCSRSSVSSLGPSCSDHLATLMPLSFLLGLLCIWWNPKWQYKLAGQHGRLEGLNRYYQLQILLLVLRFSVWAVLRDLPGIEVYRSTAHTFCLVLLGVISLHAWFNVVRVDTTPLLNWNQPQKPLVDPNQFMQPERQVEESLPGGMTSSFTVDNLNRSHGERYEAWQPPTPPADAEIMEWESTTTRSELNLRPRPVTQKFQQISPFYGNLPAQPTRGSLNPRNPPPAAPRQALGIPPGFFGLSKSAQELGDTRIDEDDRQDSFKPATFFSHNRAADTGLENLFDSFFSVHDDTALPRPTDHDTSTRLPQTTLRESSHGVDSPSSLSTRQSDGVPRGRIRSMAVSCTVILGLSITATSLCWLEYLLGEITEAPSTMLGYTAFIPLLHVVEDIVRDQSVGLTSLGMIVQGMLILASWLVVPEDGTRYVPVWNKLVIGVVFVLILQEGFRVYQLQHPAQLQRKSRTIETRPASRAQPPELSSQSIAPYRRSPLPPAPAPAPAPPPEIPNPFLRGSHLLRTRSSLDSIDSSTSTQTRQSSTTAGWNTPHAHHRSSDWHPDHNKYVDHAAFSGSGNRSSIAGTRARRR